MDTCSRLAEPGGVGWKDVGANNMVRSGPTPGAVAAFLGLLLLGKLARAVFDTMNHKALWVWFIPHGYIVYYVVRYQIIRAVKAQYRRAGNQA